MGLGLGFWVQGWASRVPGLARTWAFDSAAGGTEKLQQGSITGVTEDNS